MSFTGKIQGFVIKTSTWSAYFLQQVEALTLDIMAQQCQVSMQGLTSDALLKLTSHGYRVANSKSTPPTELINFTERKGGTITLTRKHYLLKLHNSITGLC